MKLNRARIEAIVSYVHTCKKSYRDECGKGNSYENCLFIDPDNFKNENGEIDKKLIHSTINKHLLESPNNRILYYISNTGDDDCFSKRAKPLQDLNQNFITVIEEGDFGSWREKQTNKLKKLLNSKYCVKTYVTSGTGTNKLFKTLNLPLEDIGYIKRDYILDVLNSSDPLRSEAAVGIKWATLDNFEDISKDCTRVENWSSMCNLYYKNEDDEYESVNDTEGNPKLDSNGEPVVGEILPRNKDYFKAFGRFYFNHLSRSDFLDEDRFELMKERSEQIKDNDIEAISMIWVPGTNNFMNALKELWKDNFGDTHIFSVINGDTTSNAEAENHVKTLIKVAKHSGKRLVLIANKMANRSFTEPYVKNIVLMFDGTDNEDSVFTTNQKFSRAFSPWKGHNIAYILDLRSSNGVDKFACWISQLGINCIKGHIKKTEEEIIRILTSIPKNKFSFSRHFTEEGNVFTTLSEAEVREMMYSHSYGEAKVLQSILGIEAYIADIGKSSSELKTCLNEDIKNFTIPLKRQKGRGNEYTKVPKKTVEDSITPSSKDPEPEPEKDNTEELEEETKLTQYQQHALFIYNHYNIFKHYMYDKDILENEIKDIKSNFELKESYESLYGISINAISDIVMYWKEKAVLGWFDSLMTVEI